jgi:hypothetical protein
MERDAAMLRRHNAWLATSALSLLTIGCSTVKNEPAPTGATQALPRSSVPMTYYVDMVGPVVNPLSKPSIEVPSKELLVSGWAVDYPRNVLAGGVDIVIDHIPYAAHYGISRKDVAAYYKQPSYENSGFDFTIPAVQMTRGVHVFAVRVVANDGKSYWESPEFTLVVQ